MRAETRFIVDEAAGTFTEDHTPPKPDRKVVYCTPDAPAMRRHVRTGHDAFLRALQAQDWRKADELFQRMPAQYRAVTLLCAYHSRQAEGAAHV
jgi:DNA-directed RNA polymerase specialized sigma24 family protein